MNILSWVMRGNSGQWWYFRPVGQERLLGRGDSKNKKEREELRHTKGRTIYYLSVLETKSPKPRHQLGHTPSSLSHLLLAPDVSRIMAASLQFLLHFHSPCLSSHLFSCVSLSLCLNFSFLS